MFFNNLWFPILKIAELQEAENTRICSNFFMALDEDVLLCTLITMVQKVFEKNHFKVYLSQSKVSKYSMHFLGSRTCPYTEISCEGIVLDAKHDDLKILQIFDNFVKFRNHF